VELYGRGSLSLEASCCKSLCVLEEGADDRITPECPPLFGLRGDTKGAGVANLLG